MGCALARQREGLQVVLLVRDAQLAADINTLHRNTRWVGQCLPGAPLLVTKAARDQVSARAAVLSLVRSAAPTL